MTPRLVRESATLAIRDDGTLKLAVVADTHSQPHAAIRDHLAAIGPDAILHAGDIGDAAVIDQLAKTAPVFAVRGNIDTRTAFPDVLTLDLIGAGRQLRIFLIHILTVWCQAEAAGGGADLGERPQLLAQASHADPLAYPGVGAA